MKNKEAFLAFKNQKIFGSLDGLRCLAILAVLWHHSGGASVAIPLLRRGYLGVDLFFVISGFLITTLLLREEERNNSISLKKFYMRRFLRIFPPYYALLIVTIIAFSIATMANRQGEIINEFFDSLWILTFYLSNWIVPVSLFHFTWSLAAEEQFYLVFPPLVRFFKKKAFFFALLFLIFNQYSNFSRGTNDQSYALTILDNSFTPILCGVILAYLFDNSNYYILISRVLLSKWFPVISLGLFLIGSVPEGAITGFRRLSVLLSFVILIGGCVAQERNSIAPILSTYWIARIGKISYGIYLYHMFCRHLAVKLLEHFSINSPPFLFVTLTLITLVCAEISFRYFEQPILNLRSRFRT